MSGDPIETRTGPDGFTYRRYAAGEHKMTTVEVPLQVWARLNSVGRQRDRAAQAARAIAREKRVEQARELRGHLTPQQIALKLNISVRTAQRWIK